MKLILVSLFSALFITNASAQSYSIGRSSESVFDPSRNRAIPVEVYYPALSAGTNAEWATGTFPLIILGHGFAMTYSAYENISSFFVPKGYVFAMIDTENGLVGVSHGNFAADYKYVKENLNLPGTLEQTTAYLGHSMGGGAAFLAASLGNQPDLLIGLAPAETNPSAISASSLITIPTFVFSGEGDAVTPPSENHIPMYDDCASDCKGFISILGGAHCYFAQSNFFCDFGETTAGSDIQINRAQQQDVLFDFLEPLFQTFLRDNNETFAQFSDSLALSSRVSGTHTCDENALSFNASKSNLLTVYPSPASHSINIKSFKNKLGHFEIRSSTGKLVSQGNCDTTSENINISAWPAGIYHFKNADGQIRFKKLDL
ncbi:MAG: T9SS type A sorting domain-containing protein [Bacteroidia bacterium]